MSPYIPNQRCHCPRCRSRGLMAPAILITLGTLFMLHEYWIVRWDESFPVLLIVIGIMLYLRRSASTEGHVDPPVVAPVAPVGPMPPPPAPGTQSHGPEVNS